MAHLKTTSQNDNITKTLAPLLKVGKYVGALPLANISSLNGFIFKIKSPSFVYSVSVWFIFVCEAGVILKKWIIDCLQLNQQCSLSPVVYILNIVSIMGFYINFARKFPLIMPLWYEIDRKMFHIYGYPKGLTRNVKTAIFLYSCLALTNEFLTQDGSLVDLFVNDKTKRMAILDYFFTIHNVLGKSVLHFNDIFFVIIAFVIKARFCQLNRWTEKQCSIARATSSSVPVWQTIREDYDRLATLVFEFNKLLSHIVLLTLGFNSFWILKVLAHILKTNIWSWDIHILYSNIFVVFRTFTILWCCIEMNNESRKIAAIINFSNLPTLNVEILRLLKTVQFDSVFLSGSKLFEIKSGIILNMIGGILTYELVLIQQEANL